MAGDEPGRVDTAAAMRLRLDRRAAARLAGGAAAGVALLSAAPGRAGSPAPTARERDATPVPGPNLYELNGPGLSVTYATSSIIGEPQLTLADASGRQTFAGDLIRVEETAIGRLVTVELAAVPDLQTDLFSLLLPVVGQVAIAPQIAALAIFTTERTSIAGPAGVEGARQSYRVVEVTGTARSVVF